MYPVTSGGGAVQTHRTQESAAKIPVPDATKHPRGSLQRLRAVTAG